MALLEGSEYSAIKQGQHTLATRMHLEEKLKSALEGLTIHLFGVGKCYQ